jgi:flagellar hook assembly protein FlgD
MRIVSVLTIIFLLAGFARGAVDPPDLRCVAVQPNGDVVLTWIAPNDPANEFVEYVVGVSNSRNGTYTETSVANLATTTFTNTNSNATTNSEFYYVKTVYDDGSGNVEVSSDTFETMLPVISNKTDTTATVTWNPQIVPNLPSNSGNYEVFRSIDGGPWVLVGTTPYGTETFTDTTFKVCSEDIAFKVETEDNSGCRSVSAVVEELFEDNTSPDIPIMDSVTVDTATGNLELSWQSSEAGDTDGYQILYYDLASSAWIIIDTVYGKANTTYIDSVASGSGGTQQYAIASFDTCYKGNPATANISAGSDAHQSIYLETFPDFCAEEVRLEWSQYQGWNDLQGYAIYYRLNNGPSVFLDSVPGSDSTYLHENVDVRQDYCYVIVGYATDRSKTSTSNIACPQSAASFQPNIHYLQRADVVNSDYVEIECLVDTSIFVNYYALERAIDSNGTFIEIARAPYDQNPILQFEDRTAQVNQTDYWYRVVMYDSCDFPISISNLAKTIYLNGTFDEQTYNAHLSWTAYIGWGVFGDSLDHYDLFRVADNAAGSMNQTLTTGDTLRNFEENTETYITEGNRICYIVRATNRDSLQVYSNRKCFKSNTKIWVPNAFKPTGIHNPEFKPTVAFGGSRQYRLQIFNRFGNLVFESTNIERGWDGTAEDGSAAQQGAYAYRISLINQSGDEEVKMGSVILIR